MTQDWVEWHATYDDPSIDDRAVDELLRYDGPVQHTVRIAMVPVSYSAPRLRERGADPVRIFSKRSTSHRAPDGSAFLERRDEERAEPAAIGQEPTGTIGDRREDRVLQLSTW